MYMNCEACHPKNSMGNQGANSIDTRVVFNVTIIQHHKPFLIGMRRDCFTLSLRVAYQCLEIQYPNNPMGKSSLNDVMHVQLSSYCICHYMLDMAELLVLP